MAGTGAILEPDMTPADATSPPLSGLALRAAIRNVVQPLLDLDRHQLFLFGSEASGLASRTSDIDIGVLGPDPVPGAVVQQIRERLDTLRTLRRFDVVDFGTVDEAFRTHALQHAERL